LLNTTIYPWVAIVSLLFTYVILLLLRKKQLFDLPNARSSHTVPVPRGGGVSFAVLYLILLGWLAWSGRVVLYEALVLMISGAALALVGFIDDRIGLSFKIRLFIQITCMVLSLSILYYFPLINGSVLIWFSVAGMALAAVWWINLFNFLDGIDGYACSEAVLICMAAAGLCRYASDNYYPELFLLLAAVVLGFAVLNWSPAKLFMGDVGSYFLGAIIALLAVLTVRDQLISPLTWVVLTSLFWVDASMTLLRRILNGARWSQAHRSHAYQILSRRWHSHQQVSLLAIVVNTFWLIPLSFSTQWLANSHQYGLAVLMIIIASLPIVSGVYWLKSGVDNG